MPVTNLNGLQEKPKGSFLKSCRILIAGDFLLNPAPKVRKNRYKYKDDTILFPCVSFRPGFEYKQLGEFRDFKCR
jgi:hypothetical protein